MIAASHNHAPDQTQNHNAKEHAHEPDVEFHITVQNMAELVCDNTLQFVAIKELERAAGHCNRRITR